MEYLVTTATPSGMRNFRWWCYCALHVRVEERVQRADLASVLAPGLERADSASVQLHKKVTFWPLFKRQIHPPSSSWHEEYVRYYLSGHIYAVGVLLRGEVCGGSLTTF